MHAMRTEIRLTNEGNCHMEKNLLDDYHVSEPFNVDKLIEDARNDVEPTKPVIHYDESISFDDPDDMDSNDNDIDIADDNDYSDSDASIDDNEHMIGSVILDEATMGAVKRNDNLFLWQIEGLIKDNGKQHSALYLNDNPPKLVFRRPGMEPFTVFLGREEVNQLAPALERVRRAYNSVPIDGKPKREHWSRKNWKRKIKEAFEDNPLGMIGKALGLIGIIAIIIIAFVI